MDTPTTPLETPIAAAAPVTKDKKPADPSKQTTDRLKSAADRARTVRDKLVDGVWKENVEYRRGKPFEGQSKEARVSVPVDWSFTKSKEAGLFSVVPAVILEAAHDRYKPAVPMMQKELNDVLTKQCKVGVAMEEVMADVINAAGVAGVLCGIIATFRETEIPDQKIGLLPPELKALPVEDLVAQGHVKMLKSQKRMDYKFFARRLSPSQLLWDVDRFKGSDFDDSDWVGHDDTCMWAEALREFGKSKERPDGLTEEMKEMVCGGAEKADTLSPDSDDSEAADGTDLVSYTRVFYWAARQDPDCCYLEQIKEIVWVKGVDKPVLHRDLPAQKWDESTASFIGVTKFPLRIGTLTYITDMPVPPSDSEVGRPQVDEKMRSRSQMILQRDRSAPMRWANVNRVDPMILQNMMRGDYQQIIPVNGDGQSAIGETARANYPGENWEFDKVTDKDLGDSWQVGPNQAGGFNPAGRTAAEANHVQAGFATRQAKERAKNSRFFCSIAEVIMGYMQMFHDGPQHAAMLGEQEAAQLQDVWDRSKVSAAKFVCTIREDSTVKLDSQQQLERVSKFLNLAGKSGFANVPFLVGEMALLSGLDPAKATTKPSPKEPEPANMSLRVSGEDLQNPIIGPYLIAQMQKGHPIEPTDIEAAKMLLVASSSEPAPPPPPQPGVPGAPPPAGPGPGQLPPGAAPQPPKDFGPMPRVSKRTEEFGG